MTELTKNPFELFNLVREHKKNEKELKDFIDQFNHPQISPINEKTVLDRVLKNHALGERIRELLDEIGLPTFKDPFVLEHLRRIRNGESETDKLYSQSIFYDLSTNCERATRDVLKKLDEIEQEECRHLNSTLDEMHSYFDEWAGDSLTFSERKKEFGTILVERSLPPNIEPYLRYIKHCYLLNMNEAVIGLSRILIEVACRSIYDKIPAQDKSNIQYMDSEISCCGMIRQACKYRLNSKKSGETQRIEQKAVDLYNEASSILHGKLLTPKTDEETLAFIRDVFSFIESLY